MIDKINVLRIVKDHFGTFSDYDSGKLCILDFCGFIGIPAAVGIGFSYVFGHTLGREAVDILITALSVFAALLFNLLLLVYDVVRKDNPSETKLQKQIRRKLLEQVYSNISYAILVSIIGIVVLLFGLASELAPVRTALSAAGILFITNFGLTLMMILKRIHALLAREMKS